MAEWEEKAEYSKSEYMKTDEPLTDKKKEVEQAQGELSRVTEELDEATRKKEIALDLYHRLSTDTENTDLFDKVVGNIYVKCNIILTIIFGKCKMKYILQMPNEREKNI